MSVPLGKPCISERMQQTSKPRDETVYIEVVWLVVVVCFLYLLLVFYYCVSEHWHGGRPSDESKLEYTHKFQ
ncbi:hypothetical protein CY35_16G097100 [Sphagnum magellanicum]|nr:hypothetical protein CY35_16G097100 [Sphagnum magellanicum]